MQIADAQFNFVSAVSAGDPYEARFRAIEASLSKIASALQQKTSPVGNAAARNAKTKTRAAPPPGSVPRTPRPPGAANDLAGLDPAVYRSALDSGVSPHELRELGGLLGRRGHGLADYPQAQIDALGDGPLCAPEGSRAGSSAGSGDPDHRLPPAPQVVSPVEAAVVNLTKIVGELAKAKHTPAKGSDLERALDKAEGFAQSGEAIGSSGGRSKSAAFRILKETLINDPAQIYGPIERLLEEDLIHRRVGSSLQDSRATSRAWLEYRSNLGHYPTTTRLAWCIAGIWNALRSQRPDEARARAALAIACVDQQALDGGAWTLAEQFSLEGPPPLASFANRRHSGLEHSDTYHSRIFESRWAELCLHKVRELEQHLEAKRKLAGRGRPPPPDNTQEARGDRPERGAPKGGKGGENVPLLLCCLMAAPGAGFLLLWLGSTGLALSATLHNDPNLQEYLLAGSPDSSSPGRLSFFSDTLAEFGPSVFQYQPARWGSFDLLALVLDSLSNEPLHRVCRGPGASFQCRRDRQSFSSAIARGWARVAEAVQLWDDSLPVDAASMGRAACKVEKIEEQLQAIAGCGAEALAFNAVDFNMAKDL